jgi:hypothetical protein
VWQVEAARAEVVGAGAAEAGVRLAKTAAATKAAARAPRMRPRWTDDGIGLLIISPVRAPARRGRSARVIAWVMIGGLAASVMGGLLQTG